MIDFYTLTLQDLENEIYKFGENKAKAKIIFKEIYQNNIENFSDIKQLNSRIIEYFNNAFTINIINCKNTVNSQTSSKTLFELNDGNLIEAVLMRQKYGNSVCISTQVGCNMGCSFCESGRLKKIRNLTCGEMVAQVLALQKLHDIKISNISIMGIGEPLDNYEQVVKFIEIMTSPFGLAIGTRRITLSTCGVVPTMYDYADRDYPNSLAISLHAPNNQLRNSLLPINKAYPLEKLRPAMEYFAKNCNRKVMVEYIMIDKVNDSIQHAKELADYIGDLRCTVNLIPYNQTSNSEYKRSEKQQIMDFYNILKQNKICVTMRREFGESIDGACGQLRSAYQST